MILKRRCRQLAAIPILWQTPHFEKGRVNNSGFSKKYRHHRFLSSPESKIIIGSRHGEVVEIVGNRLDLRASIFK